MKKSGVILIYSVLVLGTLLVFWQVGKFDFVNYDDTDYVTKNPQVLNGLSVDGIVWAFTSGHAANWHPVTWLSLMLDCQLFGINPGRMHFVNMGLHILNVLLLFGVLKKMSNALWASGFVAAAFAVHPMHVESVAWIAERKDVLSTLFFLLTIGGYVSFVKRGGIGRYLLTLLLFVTGLLAKPMLVTLPFLLLLLDHWPLDRFKIQSNKGLPSLSRGEVFRRIISEKIPFFILAGGLSIVTFLVQQAGGTVADVNRFALSSRVANAFLSYIRYIGKIFWPTDMTVFYPFNSQILLWKAVLCLLVLISITIFVIRYREQKYLATGWFWYVGTLMPVIGLVQVGEQSMADRYSYIPYIGLFIMITWGAGELISKFAYRKIILSVTAVIAILGMGIVTYGQCGYWKDSFTIFTHAVEVTENNYIAYNNLGVAYGSIGNYQEALKNCNQAITINSNCAQGHYNLGVTYGKLGQMQNAIEAYKRTIKIKKDYAEAYNSLGVAYGKVGNLQNAIDSFNETVKIKPDFAEAHYNLGSIYSHLGRQAEAIDAYKMAIKAKPDYVKAHYNLGVAYLMAGEKSLAMEEYGILKISNPEQAHKLIDLAKSGVPEK